MTSNFLFRFKQPQVMEQPGSDPMDQVYAVDQHQNLLSKLDSSPTSELSFSSDELFIPPQGNFPVPFFQLSHQEKGNYYHTKRHMKSLSKFRTRFSQGKKKHNKLCENFTNHQKVPEDAPACNHLRLQDFQPPRKKLKWNKSSQSDHKPDNKDLFHSSRTKRPKLTRKQQLQDHIPSMKEPPKQPKGKP